MILIIDGNKRRRETLAEMFYYMGIPSYASDKDGAISALCPEYKAILISEPEKLTSPEEYVKALSKAAPGTPIFSVSERKLSLALASKIDLEIESGIYSSALAAKIIEYQKDRGLKTLGKYMLAGLDASCDVGGVKYLSKTVNLTKTETMIVRYLILSYPNPKSAPDILAHAYKKAKLPEDAAVRTQISLINRKFSKIKSERLIARTDTGYVIATPEFWEKLKFN